MLLYFPYFNFSYIFAHSLYFQNEWETKQNLRQALRCVDRLLLAWEEIQPFSGISP